MVIWANEKKGLKTCGLNSGHLVAWATLQKQQILVLSIHISELNVQFLALNVLQLDLTAFRFRTTIFQSVKKLLTLTFWPRFSTNGNHIWFQPIHKHEWKEPPNHKKHWLPGLLALLPHHTWPHCHSSPSQHLITLINVINIRSFLQLWMAPLEYIVCNSNHFQLVKLVHPYSLNYVVLSPTKAGGGLNGRKVSILIKLGTTSELPVFLTLRLTIHPVNAPRRLEYSRSHLHLVIRLRILQRR